MRHIVRLQAAAFCALCLMLFVGAASGQNLLTNPDLDLTSVSTQTLATPTGWTATATKTISGPFSDGMSSETFANVQQPGGFGLFFKPFQGGGVNTPTDLISASLSQDKLVSPGSTYTMTGWAGAGASYIGLTDPTVGSTFHLKFLNSSSVVIADNVLNLVTAGLGTGTPTSPATGFGYHPYSITATAPAGTLFARVEADMTNAYTNPAGGDQAFVVDAFSLAVPEPMSLSLIALGGVSLLARRRAVR
jgi:hypothetical protein